MSEFLKLLYSMYPQLEHYYIIPRTDNPEKWVTVSGYKDKGIMRLLGIKLKWRGKDD